MLEAVRAFQVHTQHRVRPAVCFERGTLEELKFLFIDKFVTLRSLDSPVAASHRKTTQLQERITQPQLPPRTVKRRKLVSRDIEDPPFSCELP